MRRTLARLGLVAAAALLTGTATEPASAASGSTDYTVTLTSNLYEDPPDNPTRVNIATNATLFAYERIALPFSFPYFGQLYDHTYATCGGYLQFLPAVQLVIVGAVDPSTVPTFTPGFGIQNADGACAALWEWIPLTTYGSCVRWTAGNAPNRRMIVSWENCSTNSSSTARVTFQIKLYESSGVIEFAYKPDSSPSTWTGLNYSTGLVAPGADPRWVVPENTSITNHGHPAYDYRFTPRTVRFRGRVLYDRLTPTASGLGTSTSPAPLSGLRLEVHNAGGAVNAVTTADMDGNFDFTTTAGYPDSAAELFAYAMGKACAVRPLGAGTPTPASVRVTQNLGYASDMDTGTLTIGDALDPNSAFRRPANVARAIERVHAWAASRTEDAIPALDVTFDPATGGFTTYYYAGPSSPPNLTVAAGPGLATLDAWDDGVIQRAYGVHVLASIASPPSPGPQFDGRFDAASDPYRAFAAGFGCYLHAVVEGSSKVIDSTGAGNAQADDLESPSLTSAKGPTVSGCVAGALFDLMDGANETIDWADGSSASGADPFTVADSMTSPPTASRFAEVWADAGRDGAALSRTFIAHGLLADDAAEPNDVANEGAPLAIGTASARRDGLVLNIGNDDWFAFDLAQPAVDLRAEVSYARLASIATIEVQILNAAGQVLADEVDGTLNFTVGVVAGALPAGSYRLRVHHVSGHVVPSYTVQVSDRVEMDRTPLKGWTKGIAYAQPTSVIGGIPPYAFAIQSGSFPPGLLLDRATGRVSGLASDPGPYDFSISVQDAGEPAHSDLVTHHVEIAEPLAVDLGEFVAFAAARPIDVTRPHVGGTAPLVVSITDGRLPEGLSLAADDLRFTGTPALPGSSRVSLAGVDVAGSASSTSTTAVVCVPIPSARTPVDLASGASACGFFYDAVAGSTASIAVSTAPKQARRALRIVVLGPDGRPVAGGKFKAGKGKASATGLPAAVTGRYFAVVAADDDGVATQLLGTQAVKAPTRDSGSFDDVAGGSTVEVTIGALAGAKLDLTVKPAKKSPVALTVVALIDPNGASVPLDGLVSTKSSSARLAATLNASGTWTVRVRAAGLAAGDVSWTYKLKEPRGVVYREP